MSSTPAGNAGQGGSKKTKTKNVNEFQKNALNALKYIHENMAWNQTQRCSYSNTTAENWFYNISYLTIRGFIKQTITETTISYLLILTKPHVFNSSLQLFHKLTPLTEIQGFFKNIFLLNLLNICYKFNLVFNKEYGCLWEEPYCA